MKPQPEAGTGGPTMGNVRRWAKALLPPVVATGLRRLRDGRSPQEWSYRPSWPVAGDPGWAEPAIAETQAKRLRGFAEAIAAPRPLGVSAEAGVQVSGDPDYAAHNTYLAFAYAFARAALDGPPVSVLDWGGGLGQYRLLLGSLFPDVAVSYTCHDLQPLVEAGASLVDDVAFDADPDRVLAGRYSLVVASGSLHYTEAWPDLLRSLSRAATRWLYVTRLPVVIAADDYVLVQHAHRHGYPASYPGWVLNRARFVGAVEADGFELVRELLIDERPPAPGAPEQPEYRGFLFRRTEDG